MRTRITKDEYYAICDYFADRLEPDLINHDIDSAELIKVIGLDPQGFIDYMNFYNDKYLVFSQII